MNNLIESGNLLNAKGHIISGVSGLLTALAANAVVAAIRNVGPAEVVVDSVDQAFLTTTAAAAATASLAFGWCKVPGFSALLDTGARATEPVPVRKRNSEHRVLPSVLIDVRDDAAVQVEIANTAALSGLTISPALVTDDPQDILVPELIVSGSTGIYQGRTHWAPHNNIPMTLAPNEGLVFFALTAFPGTLVGRYFMGADVHIA
jgi:hypothetical protein